VLNLTILVQKLRYKVIWLVALSLSKALWRTEYMHEPARVCVSSFH